MEKENMVDDIVAFLDQSVTNGVEHLNVDVKEITSTEVEKAVETSNNMDCAKGNLACRIPTLDAGIDKEIE